MQRARQLVGAAIPWLFGACATAPVAPVQRVEVPAAHAAAPAAPAAPAALPLASITLAPVAVDAAALAAPEQLWTLPAGRVRARRAPAPVEHGIIVGLPGDAGVQLVDAATGATRWKRHAAKGERWIALAVGEQDEKGYVVVLGTGPGDRRSLIRLDPASGSVRGRQPVGADVELERGEHGGLELVDREHCQVSILDAASGKQLGAPLAASRTQMRDFKGRPGGTCRNTVALHGLADAVASVSFLGDGAAHLAGIGASGTLWERRLGGQVVDVLDVARHDTLFAAIGVTPATAGSLLRVQLSSGNVLFERPLRAATNCHDVARVRAVNGPAGHAHAVLVQDCADVALLDAVDGARLWTAHARGIALVEGEPDHAIAPGAVGSVEWFGADGASSGQSALPVGVDQLRPLDGGLLLVTAKRDAAALIDRDASVRWQYAVAASKIDVVDDRVVVSTADQQLWIEPHSGRVTGSAGAVGWTLGRAAADPELWVDQLALTGLLRALRLP